MSDDLLNLAIQFDKPVEYVEKCLAFHDIQLPLPRFRVPDDGFSEFFSDMTAIYDDSPSLTKQEFSAECDINTIMARFKASGGDPSVLPLTTKVGRYGDFSNMPDSYHAALNYVKDTEKAFLTFDASVRSRFNNDPQLFLDFVADPSNFDELVKLGLTAPVVASGATQTAKEATTGQVSQKPSVSSSNEVV